MGSSGIIKKVWVVGREIGGVSNYKPKG